MSVLGVPQVFPSDAAIQSFTLHDLQPDTVYILQVRCRFAGEGLHWSDWSMNVTKKTPEDGEFWDQTLNIKCTLNILTKLQTY